MRIAVMGMGGVGGYFGGKLAGAGNEVTFIARGRHGEAIARAGLEVRSPDGDFTIADARVVGTPAEARPPVEAVLFTVKMTDAETAARALRPLVDDETAVFCVQNGVEVADLLAPILGRERLVPGVAQISATLGAPGTVLHAGGFTRLVFGEADRRPSVRTAAFHAVCTAAGFDARISDDIRREIWRKFLFLAPFAAMTALTRSALDAIRAEPRTHTLLRTLVDEIFVLGRAVGVGFEPSDVDNVMKIYADLPGDSRASMAFDLEHGKPLELPFLSGAVTRLARAHGTSAPTHAFVSAALALQEGGRKMSA